MGIDDTDLLAYVDGHLPPLRMAEIETAVATTAGVAARLRAMRASALPYATAFNVQALPPVPPQLSQRVAELLSARGQRTERRASSRRRWSWAPLGAAFAAGVLCCAIALKLMPYTAPAAAQIPPWITAAADYQRLYTRATVENVTEDPALSARVVEDLRLKDGLVVVIPDLRSAALAFKRVQRLSFHERPVVQMVYLPEHGDPIALCVTPDARPDETPHAQQIGELNSVAWRRDNLGYVVLGKGPARALLDLGRRIASGETPRLYGRSSAPPTRRAA